ncbi:MAG: hypothetical protein EOO12_00125 [Chitinophagaceae bacterium]|nr:MAG: hypothetical protein EOO12_00125 [Chitinophagaceae bacterium]
MSDEQTVYSGEVLDAGIFPGVPATYRCHLPEFYVLKNERDPLGAKAKFIWDFDREAWVWDAKA